MADRRFRLIMLSRLVLRNCRNTTRVGAVDRKSLVKIITYLLVYISALYTGMCRGGRDASKAEFKNRLNFVENQFTQLNGDTTSYAILSMRRTVGGANQNHAIFYFFYQ